MGNPERYLEIAPVFSTSGLPVPPFTDSDAANRFLGRDPNALLIGMVLDQQIPAARAFAGPYLLQQRLGHLNPRKIAAMDPADFLAVMTEKPAIHRFPASMAKRVQDACRVLVQEYGGKANTIWDAQPDARTVMQRLAVVPGIGATKQRLAMLLLGRYYGVDIPGWREAAPLRVPA